MARRRTKALVSDHGLLAGALLLVMRLGFAFESPALERPNGIALSLSCAACHGPNGHSVGAIPSIAGRPEREFIELMLAFQRGSRSSTVMQRLAKGYTEADFAAMAAYFVGR